jgi:hypothetical protein
MTATNPQTRLAVSRSRLRLHLQQWQSQQAPDAPNPQQTWLDALRAEPGTRVLLNALQLWWAQQPWHQASAAFAASVGQLLRPLAQRSPLLLVVGAAALGSALVLLKPWRWLSLSTLAAGLLPQLLPKLLALLRPLSWIDMLNGWIQTASKSEP